MPHLILEHSANIESHIMQSEVIQHLHATMIASGLFNASDVKSRSYCTHNFAVGEKAMNGSFGHVSIYLLEGRTQEQKINLTQSIRKTLGEHLHGVDQLSVDIRDMVRDTYQK